MEHSSKKTLRIAIETSDEGYKVTSAAYNGDKRCISYFGEKPYVIASGLTLSEAEDLQSRTVFNHNKCEEISPSKVSRLALAV